MSPTPRSKPLPEPIRVRSLPPYGRPTAEQYADSFNNYGGGVNPLGYLGHEFAPDGSYGYRPRDYSTRPLASARKPPLPPQPKPTYFDFGQDDEDALSMPVPDHRRKHTVTAPVEHHHNDQRTDTCCPLLAPATASPSLPWICLVRSSVLNNFAFVAWRIALVSYSLAALIVATVYGVSSASLIVLAAFAIAFVKELVLTIALVVFTTHKPLEWKEHSAIGSVGVLFQIAAHVTFSAPILLASNLAYGPPRSAVPAYITSTPCMYLAVALCSLYLLDIFFTGLPPRPTGIIIGALITFIAGFVGIYHAHHSTLLRALVILTLASVAVPLVLHVLIKSLFLSFHEPRLSRMMAASLPANVISDGSKV